MGVIMPIDRHERHNNNNNNNETWEAEEEEDETPNDSWEIVVISFAIVKFPFVPAVDTMDRTAPMGGDTMASNDLGGRESLRTMDTGMAVNEGILIMATTATMPIPIDLSMIFVGAAIVPGMPMPILPPWITMEITVEGWEEGGVSTTTILVTDRERIDPLEDLLIPVESGRVITDRIITVRKGL